MITSAPIAVRMFDSLKGLDPNVFFTPADKGYQMFARPLSATAKKSPNTWANRVPVRMSRHGAGIGSPDRRRPAGYHRCRKIRWALSKAARGACCYVINAGTGEKLSEQKLPSPPVFNGAAAANGRLFLTEEDGSVVCYVGVQQ